MAITDTNRINKIHHFIEACHRDCAGARERIEAIEAINQQKVLDAMIAHRVSARHFAPTTGYGYDDIGRDTLAALFSFVFRCEAALVRPQIVSGTHALALCLQGVLRPGDTFISAAGKPYDTLEEVIGINGEEGNGSLRDYGIGYRQIELAEDGSLDLPAILAALDQTVKLVLIQRSRGYSWRRSLSIADIWEAARAIHSVRPDIAVMVDNCYGEFTDEQEPTEVGADLVAGSLIKNIGGGLAPTGGYIAGKKELVEKVAQRLTSPGIGAEVGSYASSYQPFYQGLFVAPHTVAEALKTACLAGRAFERLGFAVNPAFDEKRNDIIQAIRFDAPQPLIAFCQAIQRASPVDSEAVPEPWGMPGYQHQVIMAAGTFVAGASIELSADAPICAPYIGYLQGALTYAHGRLAIERAIAHLSENQLIALGE